MGYLSIIVEGYFIEKFMNLCTSKQILLWNMKREKSTILQANIGIQDFRQICKIAKKTKCKVIIKQKKGLPFIMKKYKKRKIFFGALVLLFITIVILSNFIWNIEVQGNERISDQEILMQLEKDGLHIGKWKNNISTKQIIQKVRLERNDIAWIGIELKGTNAIIKVVETQEKPEILKEDEYCNIISKKDAYIVKVKAQNGTPMVKEGEVIREGTVLIAGWLEGKYTGTNYVHAEGSVEAKVWYTHTEKVPYEQQQTIRTGREENKYTICINDFKINLYKKLSNFENYDTINEEKKLKLSSNFYLPITLIHTKNCEIENKPITYTYEEAKQIGIKKAEEELLKQIENKDSIQNKNINTYEKDGYIEVEVTYEVLEEIGTKEKIIF